MWNPVIRARSAFRPSVGRDHPADHEISRAYQECLRICHDREAAEDALQGALLEQAGWLRPSNGKNGESELLVTARRHADRLRKRWVRERRRHRQLNEAEEGAAPDDGLLRHILKRELESVIPQCLGALAEADRRLLHLYFWENLSHGEIAERLRLNRSTVTKRLARVLGPLRSRTKLLRDYLEIYP